MGFRFFRRVRIAPGVSLNLTKSGMSVSAGPRGGKVTLGSKGTRTTVGIPGTGMYYTSGSSSRRGGAGTRAKQDEHRQQRVADKLHLGYFKRLVTPDDEEAFVDGCRELYKGEWERALTVLPRALKYADGAFLAGIAAMKLERFEDACLYLERTVQFSMDLNALFSKYGLSLELNLPITDEVVAYIRPDRRGTLLSLAEAYQRIERFDQATRCLYELQREDPDDVVVRLSLAEILMQQYPSDGAVKREVVRLSKDVENMSPVHAALLLYKARALRGLGMNDAARATVTEALKGEAHHSDELKKALRYERAQVYEGLGWKKRCRSTLEQLYAMDPDYEDVAERLGM